MYENLTSQQFCQWLETMEVSQEEAARLLKTDIKTLKGYTLGFPAVPPRHSGQCRYLLFTKQKKQFQGVRSTGSQERLYVQKGSYLVDTPPEQTNFC